MRGKRFRVSLTNCFQLIFHMRRSQKIHSKILWIYFYVWVWGEIIICVCEMSNFFSFSQIANESHEIIIAGFSSGVHCTLYNSEWVSWRNGKRKTIADWGRKKMLTNQRTNKIAVMRSWKFNESCASSFLFLFIIASSISSALPRFGVVISAGITHRWGKTRREPHSHEKSWKAVETYTRRPFKSLIKFLFPFFRSARCSMLSHSFVTLLLATMTQKSEP